MTRRILVVDDDDDVRTLSALSLQRVGGFEVRSAASGPEGLAVLADWVPDAVILDVMMPGMDGRETLSAIRADPRTAAVPVVFLTASVMDSELDALRAADVSGALGKPFDPLRISDELAALLGW